MQIFVALVGGLIFGFGLIVSGMTDPQKVIGFLDLAGNWDPSLAFVMAGAIAVGLVPFHFATRRPTALLGGEMHLPKATDIDPRLICGALLFGVGWGLAGYCPGPALASLLPGNGKPTIFVVAMVAGMVIFELIERLSQPRQREAL